MPTILSLATMRPEIQAQLDARYTMQSHAKIPDGWLEEHGAEVEGVVTAGHNGIATALMQMLPNLKIVVVNGVGYDKIDLAAAKSRGIRVTNTPDVLTDDVADLAVGLTITLLRRLHHAHGFVTAGKWPNGEIPLARKVSGRRYGILGMGRIGQAVGRRLAAFDGRISYTDVAEKDVPYTFVPDLVQLASGSDVLVVCAAASAATAGLVNRAVLEALGPEGALVNIARGSIVDEAALVTMLQAGKLGGAPRSTCSRTSRTCRPRVDGHGERRAHPAHRQRHARDAGRDGGADVGEPRRVLRGKAAADAGGLTRFRRR